METETPLQVGDRVATKSGLTKGTIVEVYDDGNIHVLGDTGNHYRNCMPFAWQRIEIAPAVEAPKVWARGDLCHIFYDLGDGVIWHRNGYVISAARTADLFIMFDDLDSHYVERDYCVRGHGDNPL
jgi:hypothetical protein